MHPMAILLAVAVAQWLAIVLVSLFAPRKRVLLASSAVVAIAWIAFAATVAPKTKTVAASAIAPASTGSCATLERGMTADEARARVGKPDEVRNEETIRGPKAEAWVYRGSRCAVHLVADRVEFIE